MKNLLNISLALGRYILIPALAAIGGYAAGVHPAEVSAFCGGML